MIRRIGKVLMASVISAALVAAPFTQGGLLVKASTETKDEIPQGYTPIYNIEDLRAIGNNVVPDDSEDYYDDGYYYYDAKSFIDGKYILMNDIDMSETAPGAVWDMGNGWRPIGFDGVASSKVFVGTFDGNGHYIKNMHIYGEMLCDAGLFSIVGEGAEIKNLGLVDCNIDVDSTVGAIAGHCKGINGPKISCCFVSGTIKSGMQAGGLIGSGRVVISDCFNTADVFAEHSSGGIWGGAERNDQPFVKIKNCYNVGTVQTKDGRGGSISGPDYWDKYMEIEGLYYLKPSVFEEDTISEDALPAVGLTEKQMKKQVCFDSLDFNNTWYMDVSGAYGYPQLRSCPLMRVSECVLKNLPEKLVYSKGEKLDLSGGMLSIAYEDGIRADVALEENMVSGYNADVNGTQTILVSYANGTASFEVNVKEVMPERMDLDHEKAEIDRGAKLKLNASFSPIDTTNQKLAWESDNERIATVSEDGEVKGINAGETVITAETVNGITASCTVKVNVPAKKLKLSVGKLQLKKGQKKTVKATMTPLDATDTITWLSSNSKIASVNSKGVVTAKKQGSAVITAKTSSGVSKKIKVTVLQEVQSKDELPDGLYKKVKGWWTSNSMSGRDCKITKTNFNWYDRITGKLISKEKIVGCENTKDGFLIKIGSEKSKTCYIYDEKDKELYCYYGAWEARSDNHSAGSSLSRGRLYPNYEPLW